MNRPPVTPNSSCVTGRTAAAPKLVRPVEPAVCHQQASPPPAARPTQQRDEHPVLEFFEGVFLGDTVPEENRTGYTTAGQVVTGFVPVAGQIADARDTAAAGSAVLQGKEGAWAGLGLAAVAWIPGVGDWLKGGGRAVKQTLEHAGDAAPLLRQADEAAPVLRQADGAAPPVRRADEAAPSVRRAEGAAPPVRRADEAAPSVRRADEAAPSVRRANDAAPISRKADEAAPVPRSRYEVDDPQYRSKGSEIYARGAERAVADASATHFDSAEEHLSFLAERRRAIAGEMDEPRADQFGARRTQADGSKTSMDGKYEPYNDRVPVREGEIDAATVTIDGKTVTLSTYTRTDGLATIIAPSANNVAKVMPRVEELYRKALDPSLSKQDTVKTVAEMHWLLAHAMPYARGSAAITDMFTKSVFEKRGIDVAGWRAGVAPDLEALVEPSCDAFVARYTSLMTRPPT